MFENIKNLFKRSEDAEDGIREALSEVYNERIDIYKTWGTALNGLINEKRWEDGYTYIYLPVRDAYIRAEGTRVSSYPLTSGNVIQSLTSKCEILGFSFLVNRDFPVSHLLHDRREVNIDSEIEIVTPEEFYNELEDVKKQIADIGTESMSPEMFNAITKYVELFI